MWVQPFAGAFGSEICIKMLLVWDIQSFGSTLLSWADW